MSLEPVQARQLTTEASIARAYRRCTSGVIASQWSRRGLSSGPALLLCQERLVLEAGVDGPGELSFEAAEGFAAALALGLFAGEVGARGLVHAGLGDRDPV
jgi:hypothetical protein